MKTKKVVTINNKVYNLHRSIFTINFSPIAVSDSMSGKMSGIPSISTSCLMNSNCQRYRQIKGSICEHCYAHATVKRYSGLSKNLATNFELLTESVLPLDMLPKFSSDLTKVVRFESFGDLENENHLENFANIARLSKDVTFVLWTKNPNIVKRTFDRIGKPENMIVLQSALFINEVVQPSNDYIDKIFTVYDKEGQKNNTINCGKRDCLNCQRCYRKTESVEFVNEALK